MNRNRAIAQQVGQADTRLAGDLKFFGDPTSVAVRACSLPWTLCGKGSRDLMLFPDAAIQILREARWSPVATRSYEIMSGGFHWSDELLLDVARICVESDDWSFRYVMGYRASLIRSIPRNELREPWDQLRIECPDWPGFRTERCDPSLAQELDRESKKASDDLDELDRRINAAADQKARYQE